MSRKTPAKPKAYKPKYKAKIDIVRSAGGKILVGIALEGERAQEEFDTYQQAKSRINDVITANKLTSYKVTFWGINPEHEENNAQFPQGPIS